MLNVKQLLNREHSTFSESEVQSLLQEIIQIFETPMNEFTYSEKSLYFNLKRDLQVDETVDIVDHTSNENEPFVYVAIQLYIDYYTLSNIFCLYYKLMNYYNIENFKSFYRIEDLRHDKVLIDALLKYSLFKIGSLELHKIDKVVFDYNLYSIVENPEDDSQEKFVVNTKAFEYLQILINISTVIHSSVDDNSKVFNIENTIGNKFIL